MVSCIAIACYSGQNTEDLSPLFSGYSFGRYCSDHALDINASRNYERDRLLTFLQQNPETCWVATRGTEPVGVLGLREPSWDKDFWGMRCVSIEHLVASDNDQESRRRVMKALVETADQWCRANQAEFALARPDACNLPAVHALESYGFRYIETTIVNSRDLRETAALAHAGDRIRIADPNEADLLADIAKDAFLSHHFYADPGFPKEKVDAMYRQWVLGSLQSDIWTTVVLEIENRVRGFFTYRIEDLTPYFGFRFVKWRMAALSKADRGMGYGVQLFNGAMDFVRPQAEIVDSGLTLRNTRSVNLHNSVGFRILCSSTTLHKWYSQR